MDSIQNSEVSPSNPIHLPQANVASNSIDSTTMTELNEFSRKRARMQSEEYDSELFAPLPVAPDDHSDTHPGESDSVSDDGSDPHLEGSNSVNVNERPTKRARLDVVSHVRGGWSAAEKEAVKRSEDEVQIKMEKWKGKLAKKHNAIAKAIVQNAFAVNTPQTWSGRTFNGGDATPEKLVTPTLILCDCLKMLILFRGPQAIWGRILTVVGQRLRTCVVFFTALVVLVLLIHRTAYHRWYRRTLEHIQE